MSVKCLEFVYHKLLPGDGGSTKCLELRRKYPEEMIFSSVNGGIVLFDIRQYNHCKYCTCNIHCRVRPID